MFEVIIKTLFAVFAIVGIVELLRLFVIWLLKTDNTGSLYLVISFRGHDDQAETALRSASERARWLGGDVQVICVDCGMDEQTRQICEIICTENSEILICTPDEFEKYCSGRFANK